MQRQAAKILAELSEVTAVAGSMEFLHFAESVEQDQLAHTFSVILLCTLRCLNPSHTRPSSHYVNVKPVRRITNLYDLERTQ